MMIINKKLVKDIEYYSLGLLSCFFYISILLYPFGKAFRVIGGVSCLVLLAIYYSVAYKKSNIYNFKYKKIVYLFLLSIVFNVILSKWFRHSFDYVLPTVYESWTYFFAGIEVVRGKNNVILIGIAFFFANLVEGLFGIIQYFVGYDLVTGVKYFVDGDIIRLTGTLDTYRVGNYVAIAFWPSCICIRYVYNKYSPIVCFLTSVLLFPSLFLLYYSQTRSAFLGVFIGGCFLVLLNTEHRKSFVCAIVALFLLFINFGPQRFSIKTAMGDGRWELWRAALYNFFENPLFGTGASTFNPAFHDLGVTMLKNTDKISHPHGIYVQFLSDSGVVGFVFAMIFLFFIILKIMNKIINLRNDLFYKNSCTYISFIAGGYAAYLGTAIFGHNFYRTWWLGLGMLLYGVCIGWYVVNSSNSSKHLLMNQ